jgi:hypothetical protein
VKLAQGPDQQPVTNRIRPKRRAQVVIGTVVEDRNVS